MYSSSPDTEPIPAKNVGVFSEACAICYHPSQWRNVGFSEAHSLSHMLVLCNSSSSIPPFDEESYNRQVIHAARVCALCCS